jgi:hypothetical protein
VPGQPTGSSAADLAEGSSYPIPEDRAGQLAEHRADGREEPAGSPNDRCRRVSHLASDPGSNRQLSHEGFESRRVADRRGTRGEISSEPIKSASFPCGRDELLLIRSYLVHSTILWLHRMSRPPSLRYDAPFGLWLQTQYDLAATKALRSRELTPTVSRDCLRNAFPVARVSDPVSRK